MSMGVMELMVAVVDVEGAVISVFLTIWGWLLQSTSGSVGTPVVYLGECRYTSLFPESLTFF